MNGFSLGLAGLLLIAVSCGDGASGTSLTISTTTTTAGVSTTGPSTTGVDTTTTTGSTTSTDAPGLLIEVAVRGGGVVLVVDSLALEPGVRVSVAVGSLVRIVTSGEVAEEVHVHGYDVAIDVTPGEEETAEFTADIPGIFEVELEGAGTVLLELEVS